MPFLFLVHFVQSEIYLGIDCGNYYSKTSVVKNSDTPEMARDIEYHTKTPTFIGFRFKAGFNQKSSDILVKEETVMIMPEIGEKALSIMDTRPWMGTGMFPSLLDLNDTDAKQLATQLQINTSAARVQYIDYVPLFYKLYLDHIRGEEEVSEIALVVPTTFTMSMREELQTHFGASGYPYSTTINDADAIGYIYSIQNMRRFEMMARTILFIDIGSTAIRSYLLRFEMIPSKSGHSTIPICTRFAYEADTRNGGTFLTARVAAHIRHKLSLQDPTPTESRRIFSAAEKLIRNIQESTTEASVIISDIGGRDHTIILTKEEFETIATPLAEAVIRIAKRTLSHSRYTYKTTHFTPPNPEFDDIEVIGGCSHIKFIINRLSQAFETIIKHSLDPDNCLAMGAGYYLQYRRGISKFPDIRMIELSSPYDINLITLPQTYHVCHYLKPCKRSLNITGEANIILLEYGGPNLRWGTRTKSYGLFIDEVKKGTLETIFSHSPFNIIEGKGWNSTYKTSNLHIQPTKMQDDLPIVFQQFLSTESTKDRIEKAHEELAELANETLRLISKNKTWRYFTNQSQRLEIIRSAEKAKKWLKSKAASQGKENGYLSRLREINRLREPVQKRIDANSTLITSAKLLLQTIQLCRHAVDVDWPVNKTWLPRKVKRGFIDLINITNDWLMDAMNTTKYSPPWFDRPYTNKQMSDKGLELFDAYRKILEIPDPNQPENLTQINETQNENDDDEKIGDYVPMDGPKPLKEEIGPPRGQLKTIQDFYIDIMRGDPRAPRFFGVEKPESEFQKAMRMDQPQIFHHYRFLDDL